MYVFYLDNYNSEEFHLNEFNFFFYGYFSEIDKTTNKDVINFVIFEPVFKEDFLTDKK